MLRYLRVTFVANYLSHHQIPFCEAMYERLGDRFAFVQMEPMEEERVRMGWGVDTSSIPYLHLWYEDIVDSRLRIAESDFLIAGWMKDFSPLKERMRDGRLAMRVSERIYRDGQWKMLSPRGLVEKWKEHIRYWHDPAYLLCAGAYVASDFWLIHAYPRKRLRFGYFPELRPYIGHGPVTIKEIEGPVKLMWVGRLLPLKHPEFAVQLAADLKEEGHNIQLLIVGEGEMEAELKEKVSREHLEDVVTFRGFMPPDEVRDLMEECHVFLFTSDHREGWGAVLNEAMNSGCAVVASAEAGATPYLIRDRENGMMYYRDDYVEFRKYARYLVENRDIREEMGEEAFRTIRYQWNAEIAADRCLKFYEDWKEGTIKYPEEGPLSVAPLIWPRPKKGKFKCREF